MVETSIEGCDFAREVDRDRMQAEKTVCGVVVNARDDEKLFYLLEI